MMPGLRAGMREGGWTGPGLIRLPGKVGWLDVVDLAASAEDPDHFALGFRLEFLGIGIEGLANVNAGENKFGTLVYPEDLGSGLGLNPDELVVGVDGNKEPDVFVVIRLVVLTGVVRFGMRSGMWDGSRAGLMSSRMRSGMWDGSRAGLMGSGMGNRT